MSRSGSLMRSAAAFEKAHLSASHRAYREYLETVRSLLCDVSLLVNEDSARAAQWMRNRKPAAGRVGWFDRLFLSLRLRGHGKNSADAVLEAAKAAVRMAAVHQEYVMLEAAKSTNGGSDPAKTGRYRTEDS